jgi:hypothetical protein
MLQWYGNVPAVGKVRMYAAAGASEPESQAPPSLVDVCGMTVGSQFTHATLLPDFTWMVAAWNAKSLMKTMVEPPTLVGAVQIPVLTVVLDVARSETHAATASETITTETATKAGAWRHDVMRTVI